MKRRVDDIKRDAKAVKSAADLGTDPFTVPLPGSKVEGGSPVDGTILLLSSSIASYFFR